VSLENHLVFIGWISEEVLVLRKLGRGFAQVATDLYNVGASLDIQTSLNSLLVEWLIR
jgi:hypothetical protein